MNMAIAVEGWRNLFDLLVKFLEDCGRNEETEDRNKVEYVCEQLEGHVSNIRRLHEHVHKEIDLIRRGQSAVAVEGAVLLGEQLSELYESLSCTTLPKWRQKRVELSLAVQCRPQVYVNIVHTEAPQNGN